MAKVLVAGGSGLVGSRLCQLLQEAGHEVAILSRSARKTSPYQVYQWDVEKGSIDPAAVQEAGYIINLAGAGIADKPWTAKRKALITSSRVDSTRLLLKSIQEQGATPKAFISSAAIGYYGDRGEEVVDESSSSGRGFLADSCIAWEEAIQEVIDSGIRTFYIRIGIVLSTKGGALEKMMIPSNFLLGTYFGDGKQWYSWIHIDDLCRLFMQGIAQDNLEGVINGVSPHPARNKELTNQLGKAIKKPFLLMPAPAFTLRLALGEMADTILGSARVQSKRMEEVGFEFKFPTLEVALRDLLDRKI
ncbi:MAG: TIGR01777 family oxidoreductase [Bacteroidota bacterium]